MSKGYGDFIKKHRVESGFNSQRELGKKTGISHATISRIEQDIQKPEVNTLKVLSKVLTTTSFDELMHVCGYTNKFIASGVGLSNNPVIISFLELLEESNITEHELKYLIQQAELSINFIKNK